MNTKKQVIWVLIIFGGLLAWITLEYLDHLQAFKHQNLIEVEVVATYCKATGGSSITVKSNHNRTFEVTRKVCKNLALGQRITVLRSTITGKLYWDKKPTSRILWLLPIFIVIITFIIYRINKN